MELFYKGCEHEPKIVLLWGQAKELFYSSSQHSLFLRVVIRSPRCMADQVKCLCRSTIDVKKQGSSQSVSIKQDGPDI